MQRASLRWDRFDLEHSKIWCGGGKIETDTSIIEKKLLRTNNGTFLNTDIEINRGFLAGVNRTINGRRILDEGGMNSCK
jgi:hypothetical protein